ncbi:transmembrane protein 62-like [Ylistrum balloti]|uniref:transmembrane protein 62-like n=1 Tax=Ylistrum balloti TaxID=509963 RepID=UPI002905BD0F|nr:transmembrane protein 62-like [Ylistrum balloti]
MKTGILVHSNHLRSWAWMQHFIMKSITTVLLVLMVFGLLLSFSPNIFDVLEENADGIARNKRKQATLGTAADKLFWFVQVSDIHISKFYDAKRAPDLLQFCQEQLTVIKPDFVIASGDLTDAKLPDGRGSKQYAEEWKLYQETVQKCHDIVGKWLDIRGNHDDFDVPSEDDKKNYFRNYSIQGPKHPNSYLYHHNKPWGRYSFIAMDACPEPGPRRPFNFFGYLKNRKIKRLIEHEKETNGSNMTVWFGHYPTSLIILENGTRIRSLMRNATAYLCGHLHTMAGLVPKMHARHNTGMLELELGDWKDNRLYRVLAIDHDMISFTDEKIGNWPVILVTNPKHAMYMSDKEALDRPANSTHIRILIFSPDDITTADVYIDGMFVGPAHQVQGPLFVLPWQPNKYRNGIHKLRVVVQDAAQRGRDVTQPFTIDSKGLELPSFPAYILTVNVHNLAKLLFWFLSCTYIGVLILLRSCDNIRTIYIRGRYILPMCGPVVSFINGWLLRIWLVSRISPLFYPLVSYTLYIGIGPWFVAEILEGHFGMVFIWGLYVKGAFIPGSLAYLYGIFQIVVFNIPLLLFLGYLIQFLQEERQGRRSGKNKLCCICVPLTVMLLLSIYMALVEFPVAYGSSAMIMGPVRTGSIILMLMLVFQAKKHALSNQYS